MPRPKSIPMLPLLGRRAFLQRSGLLAAGLALPAGFLAGCGDRASTAAPEVFDPSTPWWLQGDFAPVFEELDAEDLEVRGRLPGVLDGLYLRNGSNPQKSDSPHWFFGDGMLHGVRLSRGRALWYRNRYVHTDLYVKGQSFTSGSPPIAGANQSNVSVIHHGGRILTSGEVGFPFEIDPSDLSTVGVHDFGGKLNTSFTAHPKVDPRTGFLQPRTRWRPWSAWPQTMRSRSSSPRRLQHWASPPRISQPLGERSSSPASRPRASPSGRRRRRSRGSS